MREFVNTRAAASTGVTDEVAVLGGAMGLADQIIVGRYVQTAGSTMEFFNDAVRCRHLDAEDGDVALRTYLSAHTAVGADVG